MTREDVRAPTRAVFFREVRRQRRQSARALRVEEFETTKFIKIHQGLGALGELGG
jgi:hypothetical protein